MIADEELHENAYELLRNADTLIFGRITYQFMKDAWPSIVKNPAGNRPLDGFAGLIDNIKEVVFSRTLKKVEWKNARLATKSLQEEVTGLERSGESKNKYIAVGSPGFIVLLTNMGLIDEYRLNIHPVLPVSGLPFFKNISNRGRSQTFKNRDTGPGCGDTFLYAGKRRGTTLKE